MKSDRVVPVAIVGAGFSGTMVAAQLARRGVRSVLAEAGSEAGRGTAFSTTDPAHLLNVPASNMSAWPEAPEDFMNAAGVAAGDFAERRAFGRYLRSILDDAISGGCAEVVQDRATAAHKGNGGWTISLAGGGTIQSEALVLAIGNQPPAPLPFQAPCDRIVANPWGNEARAAIADSVERQSDVLIVGTGLTMVDVVLSLASAGQKGRILALSRRGLAPRSHAAADPVTITSDELPRGTVRDIGRWIREKSRSSSWRGAVDSLRPHSHALWQSLDVDERRRFLRHARPWWDVHRHRIAPQVARQLGLLTEAGQLEIAAGRILGAQPNGDELDVTIRRRGEDEAIRRSFRYIFNCTGPLHDIRRTADPLLRNLLDAAAIKPDELGIGLAVTDRSRAEGADRLWALGALTKSRYWEIIAVPDIRSQAADVADDIATELGR